MKKRILNITLFSLVFVFSSFLFSACNNGKVKVTFVTEENSDIIRYVKKGKSLVDIPKVPSVKGKYCNWDRVEFNNLKENIVVNALCYSTVVDLKTNIPSQIDVTVSSKEAEIDYILKDAEMEVTFENGDKKIVYADEFSLELGDYNKDIANTYQVKIGYNNFKKDVQINVNKITDYVTVSLDSSVGYYNEGLPKLNANTTVEGEISFDSSQTLSIGNANYKWTFIPNDTNKYAIVKGTISVTLINANYITANKQSIDVEYGTSKNQIIDAIKDGLIVKGSYGVLYKEIDSKYYSIDSNDFVENRSGVFNFKISYDENIYTTVTVNVGKCNTYRLQVEDIDEYIITTSSSLERLSKEINYSSDILGTISLKDNQILGVGEYEYVYVFEPQNTNYATKEGKIKIHTYKALDLVYLFNNKFDYGTTIVNINDKIKSENILTGYIQYNDSLTKPIDSLKIGVNLVESLGILLPGNYEVKVSYSDEIIVDDSIQINKIVLQKDIDYIITCDPVTSVGYMPQCTISRQMNSNYTFENDQFTLVQVPNTIGSEYRMNGIFIGYMYKAELVASDELYSDTKKYSDMYEKVLVDVIAV